MKRPILFVLPILILVSVGFASFGLVQARFLEERLVDEVKRKARSVAESMEISVKQVLINRDVRAAARIAERFEARERLQGCVIYDYKGEVLAVTKRFAKWNEKKELKPDRIIGDRAPQGGLQKFGEFSVYSYILPITDDYGEALGAVEVIHDTSFVFTRLTEVWKRTSVILVALLSLILVVSILTHRKLFVLPISRLTEWFQHFQRGETDDGHPIEKSGELGKLADEVEQVALSLRVARKSIIDEAQERVHSEELWTEGKLRDLVRARLEENTLFVVSNREPYIHSLEEATGEVKCMWPASGVVTALDPVLRACGGMWVAHGSGTADRRFVNSKDKLGVPPGDERYILKRVWLTKEEEEGYYYGFSNEGLWPLCHNTHTRPLFRESDWKMYRKANQKFADALIGELPAKNPFVFIQDYHFALLAGMIKEKRPDARIALFWHIPWPNPESFCICPYQREILKGMLGCDLIGFHTQYHCNNFLETVGRVLEARVDAEKFSVIRSGKETYVKPFPIGVDGSIFGSVLEGDPARKERLKKEFSLDGRRVIVGVDRIDYTKGLEERFRAFERLLEKHPEFRKKVTFVQVGAPSRTHIKRYHDLMGEIDELVERINWKYSDGDWKPIIYQKRQFSPEEIKPLYMLADACIVSSLHDGMNLVAKEFISAQNDLSGMLILSRFTGAACELSDAIQINPYAIEEFAEGIRSALEMPAEERAVRVAAMRRLVTQNNVYGWAANIITELTAMRTA
jgi:alpha,alpha-trehalose-phosphate synthase [UDP-forming]